MFNRVCGVDEEEFFFIGTSGTIPVTPAVTMAFFIEKKPSGTNRELDEGAAGIRWFGSQEPCPSNENSREQQSRPFFFCKGVSVCYSDAVSKTSPIMSISQ